MINRETINNIPFEATVTTAWTPEFESAVRDYLEFLANDYERMMSTTKYYTEEALDAFLSEMRVDVGSKYAKVVISNSAQGFVELSTGNLLMAASWKAPSRKTVRGNVFTADYGNTRWTGVM